MLAGLGLRYTAEDAQSLDKACEHAVSVATGMGGIEGGRAVFPIFDFRFFILAGVQFAILPVCGPEGLRRIFRGTRSLRHFDDDDRGIIGAAVEADKAAGLPKHLAADMFGGKVLVFEQALPHASLAEFFTGVIHRIRHAIGVNPQHIPLEQLNHLFFVDGVRPHADHHPARGEFAHLAGSRRRIGRLMPGVAIGQLLALKSSTPYHSVTNSLARISIDMLRLTRRKFRRDRKYCRHCACIAARTEAISNHAGSPLPTTSATVIPSDDPPAE